MGARALPRRGIMAQEGDIPFVEESLLDSVAKTVAGLPSQPNVRILSAEDIQALAQNVGTRTAFGSHNFVSTVKNRSAALTLTLGSDRVSPRTMTQKKRDIAKGVSETIRLLHSYLTKAPLVRVDFTVGACSSFAPRCTMYASVYRPEMVRLAHKILQSFFPERAPDGPELTLVMVPEWQEKDRQILVFPEIGVTYILGTDYYGEAKHAALRMAVWRAKQEDMLGLHAAAQSITAVDSRGNTRNVGLMILGIAGTGKTTHACHDHGLNAPGEGVSMVQDEVVFWRRDGSGLGSERGFYVKTEGLSPNAQPELYGAATSERAVLDNVMVDCAGSVYFDDRTLTPNGRAIIQKADLGRLAGASPDLPPISELDRLAIVFMTRSHTVVPIASKLTAEQAVVAFVLGESIDVSGADAKMTVGPGKEVLMNPFLVGDPAQEANAFYEMLRAHGNKIDCYLLNTGGVGELTEYGMDGSRRVLQKATRIQIPDIASIIRGIARGTIVWREDPNWMVETPSFVEGLDISRFDLAAYYDQDKIDSLIAAIRLQRAGYIEQIDGLHPAVTGSVEF